MQNAGQQYGKGGAPTHQSAPFVHSETSTNSGSITSSLRQFRKKDVEKHAINDTSTTVAESHVARVAPHNHYPPTRPSDCYRYPAQFQDYSLPSQVKYSEISDHQPLQEQLPTSVIQKAKGKEYMEMCSVQQTHMKQYQDHLNDQQAYAADPNVSAHTQYVHKEPQVHPSYKPESQYFPKEAQYPQLPHQIPKYNMPTQIRKYPTENDFLSKLRRIHPTMARSIMSDHHLQESQSSYQAVDQNRMYAHQNQRYMNYPTTVQNNPYAHGYMPPQHYSNYPACSYSTRSPQMGPRFPSINPHERSVSPRRGYSENLPMPPINYGAMPQKISPSYPQYGAPEYAQHYQHRRPSVNQDYYQQHCRPTQYMPHQMPPQEIPENRVTVSDSIKQYIENWADEETALEMNQVDSNRLCKENMRVREDPSTETVYMINASELYLENGIPLVTSESGIPLVASENGQYVLKSGVTIDNSSGMVRIVEKNGQADHADTNGERVVNLHIMESEKSDCMLAGKATDQIQRQSSENPYGPSEKPKVVVHQNTVIQPSNLSRKSNVAEAQERQVPSSLPLIDDDLLDGHGCPEKSKSCRKETVDKNCSPINVEQMEEQYKEETCHTSVICPTKPLEDELRVRQELENTINEQNEPIVDPDPLVKLEESEKPDKEVAVHCSNLMKGEKEDDERDFNERTTETKTQAVADDVEETKSNEDTLEETKTTSVDEVLSEHQTQPKDEFSEADEIKEALPTSPGMCTHPAPDGIDTTDKSVGKPSIKRTRRIFSVDDIINNIGNNVNKSKAEKETVERRRSLQLTKEFLEKEVYNSLLVDKWDTSVITRCEATKEAAEEQQTPLDKTQDQQHADDRQIEPENTDKQEVTSETTKDNNAPHEVVENKTNEQEEKISETKTEKVEEETNNSKPKEPLADEATAVEPNLVTVDCDKPDEVVEPPKIVESNSEDTNVSTQNEVQYRNAIRVEENSVLLQIAGELVEINVNDVNGKKVITVVPLSESIVVDCNDNYEPLESSEVEEQTKLDETMMSSKETVAELVGLEEMVPDLDIVEPSSEIIIGMDLSLEEEIQLDLEKTQTLCTKASKKAYEYDLQIPSITTSEDIYEKNTSSSHSVNDKVSSTREKSRDRLERKRSDKIGSSKHDEAKKARRSNPKLDKEKPVEKLKKPKQQEDEEFVPFKDLIKARKTKKMKVQDAKGGENVKADSTNKIGQERRADETKPNSGTPASTGNPKTKEIYKPTTEEKPASIKEVTAAEKLPESKETSEGVEKTADKNEAEKVVKKVTFGSVNYKEEVKFTPPNNEIRCYKRVDPRLKNKPNGDIGGRLKKKLSLEEYNSRKRKLLADKLENEAKQRKVTSDEASASSNSPKEEATCTPVEMPEKIKMPRPKSLDDLTIAKPKDQGLFKRKFSLEESTKPNWYDWEETQSPKSNLIEQRDRRLSEFRGLINPNQANKSKIVIDVTDLNARPAAESSEDEILQTYKEQVDSKLSSLNIQIPRFAKPPTALERQFVNPFSNPETTSLMKRFLKNERITPEEMERIKRIISYKRLMQQLEKLKPPELASSPLNPTYEIRKQCTEKDMKLHLKKVPEKKKRRFRNLHSDSGEESDSEFSDKNAGGAYSVVQSNALAAGVPKLIIKRKTEMPVPFVRLERLDLGLLVNKKRKVC